MEREKQDLASIPSLQEVEKEHILKVLNHTDWHPAKTCEFLRISRTTLWRKMKAYGISSHPEEK